jgi:PAS domain S-box-containing protein
MAPKPPVLHHGLPENLPHELLVTMFNSVSDGVFAVDRELRIVAFNRAAENMLGVKCEDAIGRACREVLKADICDRRCALRYTLDTGLPIVNLAIQLRDAHDHPVPATISAAVLRGEDGQVVGGVETIRSLGQVRQMLEKIERQDPLAAIITTDAHMKHLFEVLPTIARSESTVLITGETGTGKNMVAKAIHNISARRKGPLVTVNCGALPETLLESELFGYRAGAFTGAIRDRVGKLAAAEGGTIFFDEIGDMPLAMQIKVLRILQERTYERLGDVRPMNADVRVLAATNRNLAEMVEKGTFRRDLYYRINVMSIDLPPLRDRKGDIPLLTQRFVERLAMLQGKAIPGISAAVVEFLEEHDFPGNVRELENIIEHALVLCKEPVIGIEHLPQRLRSTAVARQAGSARSLRDLEASFLVEALKRNAWNRQATAKELGIHKTTLLRKIQRLGIALPRIDGRTTRHAK